MSAEIALEIVRGEAYVATGTHRNSVTNAVVDITGWTIVFTARLRITDDDPPIFRKVCGIVDGPNGVYTLTITSAESLLLDPNSLACDIFRTDPGSESQLAHGSFLVKNGVYFT
jgi:hypothetical protein